MLQETIINSNMNNDRINRKAISFIYSVCSHFDTNDKCDSNNMQILVSLMEKCAYRKIAIQSMPRISMDILVLKMCKRQAFN